MDSRAKRYRQLSGLEDIRRDQNDGVFAVVAVPMQGRSRFSRQKIRVNILRGYTEGAEGKLLNCVAAVQSYQTRAVIRTCP